MKKQKKDQQIIGAAVLVALFIIIIKIFKKMDTSYPYKKGLEFISKLEGGFVAKAFWDYKQYTNGYGTKAKSANEVITKDEAASRFNAHIQHLVDYLKYSPIPLEPSQKVAVVSFGYNLGVGYIDTLFKRIKAGGINAGVTFMRGCINAGGKPLKALADRRDKEINLLLKKTVL